MAARHGEAALAIETDLAEEDSIIAMVKRVADHFGRIDILHNNAAAVGADLVAADGGIGEMQTWVWDRSFEVNCRGTMIATREALPHLIATKGSIVNTVSGLALQGNIRSAAYGATKAAIIQMTRSVATAYGRKGVRCNAVAPGLVMTETVARDFPPMWRKLVEDETPRDRVGARGHCRGRVLSSIGRSAQHHRADTGFRWRRFHPYSRLRCLSQGLRGLRRLRATALG